LMSFRLSYSSLERTTATARPWRSMTTGSPGPVQQLAEACLGVVGGDVLHGDSR
jgi:hypothetical protein